MTAFFNKVTQHLEFLIHKVKRKVVVCSVRGRNISLKLDSAFDEARSLSYATKESETLDWIERYFQRGDVIFDVGANVGLYSLYAARHLYGECRIYAFEPEAMNFAKLNENVFLNGLSNVVIPVCAAIASGLCFDRFNINGEDYQRAGGADGLISGTALHTFGAAVDARGGQFTPIHSQGAIGVSIDHLCYEWGLEFPQHIKIDVDGIEESVIDGAHRALRDERLKTLNLEIIDNAVEKGELRNKISAAGFKPVEDIPCRVNTIFIRA